MSLLDAWARHDVPPTTLKPFWRYYGGKYRAAPHYPKPLHRTIVEPFAGAAGYSTRHFQHDVILVEKYPVIAEMWRFLIGASARDVRAIPLVEHVDDLPASLPQGAKWLVGFSLNDGAASPCRTLSAGKIKLRAMGRKLEGWNELKRERVARQVSCIKHRRLIEGDFTCAPDVEATWFVDPPYDNVAGRYYKHRFADYEALASWCMNRCGQRIVCENVGATWLPFRPFMSAKAGPRTQFSAEAIWP